MKPEISRLLPGFFLVVLIACVHKEKPEILIAKQVPDHYVDSGNDSLNKHEDTMFYGGRYFSGYIITRYDNGDTASLGSFFNGVEEGMQRRYYPNKQKEEERFYINGKKEGIQRGWWPDGKQKFYFTTLLDEYNGNFKEWYASGLLGKDFNYVNGRETGSQRLWWDNGTVRANYVVKGDKKYGLLGLKTCVNPYDSVYKK